MTRISYWDGNGIYQKYYNQFFDAMIPGHGPCPVLEGELFRAAIRIQYDFYQNAFCNDISHPFAFLHDHDLIPSKTYFVLKPYTKNNGKMYKGKFRETDPIVHAITAMMDRMMEHLICQKENGGFHVNNFDCMTWETKDA